MVLRYKIFSLLLIGAISVGFITGCAKRANIEKGPGFAITFLDGWKKVENVKYDPLRAFKHYEEPYNVTYAPKEIDPATGKPVVDISVFVVKLGEPTWMEESFVHIVESVKRGGMKILDKGQIDLDNKRSEWILYQNKDYVRLEFYVIDDFNKIYRLQYRAIPKYFNKYRPMFEKTKDTFSFKFTVFG